MRLKKTAVRTIAAALVSAGVAGVHPAQAALNPPASRYASIVMEAETGAVLYERNANLPRYPASLTKIMTLYLAFEALSQKKLAMTDQLTVSAYAAGRDPSRLDLSPGSKIKLEDAIRAITTKSANDAACAIGETLGKGNERRFAEAMTAKAKTLGLKHTNFLNASGLPENGQTSSARDLAILCKALIHDFPEYYRYFSTDTFEFHGTRYPNQNRFLHTYYGADGIKTGFVNASGHNLAASAVRGGKRLIAIVLGGDTQAWTREHATRLLDVSYAKIDPSLVMVASNATASGPDTAPAPAPSSAPATATVSTPAGAVTIASAPAPAPGLPLPNATANLNAFAAAASAPKLPAGSVGAPAAATVPAPGLTVQETPAPARTTVPPTPVSAPAAPPSAREIARVGQPEATTAARPAAGGTAASRLTSAPAVMPPGSLPPPASPAASPQAQVAKTSGRNAADAESAVTTGRETVSTMAGSGGEWSVQVGLFRDATIARRRGEEARSQMPLSLRGADLIVGRALDGVNITSRIGRLSERDAREACSHLQRGRVPCVVVPPGRPLVVATN